MVDWRAGGVGGLEVRRMWRTEVGTRTVGSNGAVVNWMSGRGRWTGGQADLEVGHSCGELEVGREKDWRSDRAMMVWRSDRAVMDWRTGRGQWVGRGCGGLAVSQGCGGQEVGRAVIDGRSGGASGVAVGKSCGGLAVLPSRSALDVGIGCGGQEVGR